MKKLAHLRVKLKELQPPDDVTPATKRFVKKHYVAKHDDPAGNDDSVFDGSNVKKAKRYPDHGYEPGQDADIYEGYENIDTHEKEAVRLKRLAVSKRRDAEGLKQDHRWSRNAYGYDLDVQANEHDHVARRLSARAAKMRKRGLVRKESTDENSPWSNIDEIVVPSFAAAISSASRIRSPKPASSPTPSKIKSMAKPEATFSDKTTDKTLGRAKSLSDLSAKMSKAAENAKMLHAATKRKNFRDYWKTHFGADVDLPEDLDPKIYDIFDELTEKNRLTFISVLSEEDGLEKISEAFGLDE